MNLKLKLFLLSFLVLFLELLLIRWIPAHIILVGFFSNFILLGSFLGIGIGVILAKKKRDLFIIFPAIFLLLFLVVFLLPLEVTVKSYDAVFFKAPSGISLRIKAEYALPLIFMLVALVFVPIAQKFGKLINEFKPLTAYTINILGSLFGIVIFSIISFLGIAPFVWFTILAVCFLVLFGKNSLKKFIFCLFVFVSIILVSFMAGKKSIWSRYYKIEILKQGKINTVKVNGSDHFYISSVEFAEPFYFTVYDNLKDIKLRKILIIGAGGGLDAAVALAVNPNVEEVDAVEIDPAFIDLSYKLNPDKPYSDPRVHVYIADGRNYLQNSQKKYDLIIFALTDSQTAASSLSNIPLESYLYTYESFLEVKKHLNENGVFALYNYYRRPWVIKKIQLMMEKAFGKSPKSFSYSYIKQSEVMMIGNNISGNTIKKQNKLSLAYDDWPFLYLQERKIPRFYLNILLSVAVIGVIMTLLSAKIAKISGFDSRLFLFGTSFLLLETKSLAIFTLLFGNTWLVSSLVFFAILVIMLGANLISSRFKINPTKLYLALFFTLFLNYIISPDHFISFSIVPKYVLSSFFYFSPIFFGSLLFSQVFRDSKDVDLSFASNILGALLGGILWYVALITGYISIILICIFFYILSFKWYKK